MLHYFAYGSNMSSPRLMARVASARYLTTARLTEHRLLFHKHGIDGSAKCNARYTHHTSDFIYGVLFQISHEDKQYLDQIEGLGKGYDEKQVSIMTTHGAVLEAVTYFATKINPKLNPYDWYKHHVLFGAREHGLPVDYINRIENVVAIQDPDSDRHYRELSIYND